MTIRYEATKMLRRGDLIIVDSDDIMAFKKGSKNSVDMCVDGLWFTYSNLPPHYKESFNNYSGGVSAVKMAEYYQTKIKEKPTKAKYYAGLIQKLNYIK